MLEKTKGQPHYTTPATGYFNNGMRPVPSVYQTANSMHFGRGPMQKY
ncbi:MAG: hypothetical protein ABR535_00640 [Pyrinomonadaceae bacterium]